LEGSLAASYVRYFGLNPAGKAAVSNEREAKQEAPRCLSLAGVASPLFHGPGWGREGPERSYLPA